MSKQLNKSIDEVIENGTHCYESKMSSFLISGTGLVFIAYPEAISRMPAPYLWGFLFFFMLFVG
jgi:SNF family Na+-dependent transporter